MHTGLAAADLVSRKMLEALLGRMFRSEAPRASAGLNRETGNVPGMVSAAEVAFYTDTAARFVGREGAIVDLGCWLGATAVALAEGVLCNASEAAHHTEKVMAFDIFEWQAWMPPNVPYCRYDVGDSFLPEARRLVGDRVGDQVELIRADFEHYEWTGGPIKILLVDAMKNGQLTCAIARSFFPSLRVGSVLIHQDFKHYFTSWIHILQYRLREYFRFAQSVPPGTVAFELFAEIPPEAVADAAEFADVPDTEADASFQYSVDLVGREECANVAAAHVMHYLHLRRRDKAVELIENYRPAGLLSIGEFPQALAFLEMD